MNKVSCFIAAYSKTNKQWLDEAVDSVRQQGVEPTVQFDEGITHQRWSQAIKDCPTDYLHVFSHDDILRPEFYAKTTAFLDSHPECSAVFTLDYIINERGERIGQSGLPFQPQDTYDFAFILNNLIRYGNFLRCPSVVFNVSRVRGLAYPECDSASDTAMWFEVLHKAGPIGIIPKPLYCYRQSSASDTQKNIIGTPRQWDHVRALEYAVSLNEDALEWDARAKLARFTDDRKEAQHRHDINERIGKGAKVRFVVAHEQPDNAGTGVVAAHRVREANGAGSGEVAFYVYPDTESKVESQGWQSGCPVIRCHPTLMHLPVGRYKPHTIEFHHTIGWGDDILRIHTEARKELYLHDLWMWRQHPHLPNSPSRDTRACVAAVQAVYANGPYLQAEARRELGCSVGLFPMPPPPAPIKYRKTIGYFGSAHPTKGIDTLLKAMRRLPDCLLVMYTHIPPEYLNGRRLYGHENVVVVGPYRRGDIPALANLTHVVAVPSLYESYGLVKEELEGQGAKVIASNVGGMAGTLEPGNVQDLVEALNAA